MSTPLIPTPAASAGVRTTPSGRPDSRGQRHVSAPPLPDTGPAGVIAAVALIMLPISACVAILRYRLYDIDLLISRTVTYGTITVLLAAAYAATTLMLGTAFGQGSAWVTAAATLVAALAFRPLRARVQDAVDRRFIRSRYHALRRMAGFLEALRSGHAAPEDVRAVLREVLSDPDLELLVFLPESQIYVDLDGTRRTGGGLSGLADRVASAGGTLRIDSIPGTGTALTAELPCGS
jgi:hypothetical protein